MIMGIGADIADIGRIEGMIGKYGDRFCAKVFTGPEMAYCGKMASPAIHFAGRWAAKEAFYKALPQVIQPHSTWKSIRIVVREGSRRPVIEIIDPVLTEALLIAGITRVHISISHEQKGYCVAFVVLENA
jgi:holo-[acyl-carrier protein] synthase